MSSPSKIQQLWELFIQAEHSSYEVSRVYQYTL